jgi:N-acetylglucosamine-6-phosphate deacetylase
VAFDLRARRVLGQEGWYGASRVVVDGGLVAAIEPLSGSSTDIDTLAAGFVDLQVNGIDDVDVASADDAGWERLDALLLAQGTTTWLPTLVTMPLQRYAAILAAIERASSRSTARTRIAGVHLEGPFLGQVPGAHRREHIVDASLDWLGELPSLVRLVTLGPERGSAAAATRLLHDRGVVVSLGHTSADDEQLDDAVACGASMVTHLFNAMSGLHHRSPGVAAWALAHPDVFVSIIADGVHVHPRMLRLALTLLGPQRSVLVTDAVGWRAGRAGVVQLGYDDGAPRLADGTLAGSALAMDAAVRNCVAVGIADEHALWAASRNPARVLGLEDCGAVEVGRRADVIALSPSLQIEQVWVGGTVCDPAAR